MCPNSDYINLTVGGVNLVCIQITG